MSNQVKKRHEVSEAYQWNLADLIVDEVMWQAYFDKVKEGAEQIKAYAGTLGQSGEGLFACLSLSDQVEEDFSRLYAFSNMRYHEDTSKASAQEAVEKVNALQNTLMSAAAFIEPEILTLSRDQVTAFYDQVPALKHYDHFFDNLFRKKEHILSKEQEELLAGMSDFAGSPSKIFAMFNDADLKFPDVIDETGNPAPLTKGNFIKYLESPDAKVRETAFKTLYDTYKKNENTLAAILVANLKKDVYFAKARGFKGALEGSLFGKNIDTKVYDALIDSVHRNIHLLHRYVKLRKKILGMDTLHMYDLYMPMIAEQKETIPYEEAQLTVLKALEVMGPDYTATVQKAFDNQWIDVYENEGKRGGAYSWGTYGVHPYILLNHQDNLKNMFTLAHELGHTMHSYYSSSAQTYTYASYPIFLAEVASTVNESLLMQHLLATTDDKKKRLFLLNHYMESFRTTLYRQTMFAEYEKMIHEKIEAGEALTAASLSSLYHDLNKFYYGDEIIVDDEIAMEWSRIPHFYYNYYVYQYATGFSSAIAIARNILDGGQAAVDNYKVFLSSGCSKYPLDTLKAAGVDMTTAAPVDNALAVFEGVLDEMEALLEA